MGLSTRGRDTGDGQIDVSLINNIRFDHDFTVFGGVVSGMEVVDFRIGRGCDRSGRSNRPTLKPAAA